MSILDRFARSGFRSASGVTGTKALAINSGMELDCVWNEKRVSRDYETGGQQIAMTYRAIVLASDFDASYTSAEKEYIGKTATRDGKTFRVSEIERGDTTIAIDLVGEEEAA